MTTKLVEHIYNPAVFYVRTNDLSHQEGEIVYTHAIPPQVLDQPWPDVTQVTIDVQTNEKKHTIRGTLIGPRVVLTSGYPVCTFGVWAKEVNVRVGTHKSTVDQAFTFHEWSSSNDPRYNIVILLLHKSLGARLGYSGLLSTPDSHLQNETVSIYKLHTLQKLEPDRLHYYPNEKTITGTTLRVNQWKTSMVIGLETRYSGENSYTIRLTPYKVKAIAKMIPQLKSPSIAFGKREWAHYFGDIGDEPPLPLNIKEILKSSCPIWPDKKVCETHLLTLIPETVNGKPLNLRFLDNLVRQPKHGLPMQYRSFYLGEDFDDLPTQRSHWTLLSRDVIPGSRNKSFMNQQKLVQKYPEYEVPNVLDTSIALFMEYARRGNELYSNTPWTYTRCQERFNSEWQLCVGGFTKEGLSVGCNYFRDYQDDGIGIQRKFY
jgi:hypothetical protein